MVCVRDAKPGKLSSGALHAVSSWIKKNRLLVTDNHGAVSQVVHRVESFSAEADHRVVVSFSRGA